MAPSGACAIKIQEVGILTKVRQFNQLINTHDEATTEKPVQPKHPLRAKNPFAKTTPGEKKMVSPAGAEEARSMTCFLGVRERSEGNDGKETWNLIFLVLFQSGSN